MIRSGTAMVAACAVAIIGASAQTAAQDAAAGVTLDRISIHAPSLEGNLLGEAVDRDVHVYLPPSYAAESDRRYPVVYFLHGYFLDEEGYHGAMRFPETIEAAFAAGAGEVIVVMPDGKTQFNGSMYSTSLAIGDWESFITRDLIAYVDANYRTIPEPASRGLSGHSMGGYGTLRLGMKHPGVYSSLYAMSSCCLDPRTVTPTDADLEGITSIEEIATMGIGATTFAASAAWSPNAANPPLYIDLPVQGGETQSHVIANYAANAPTAMLHQYVPNLLTYDAIAMDIGDQDFLLDGNALMHRLMTDSGVPHTYEIYEGDHVNRVADRFEMKVLPFFSEQLAFEPSE